jgi:hypothetical protein
MDRATATRAYASVWVGPHCRPGVDPGCAAHAKSRACVDAVSYARIGIINFPGHVDFGAGVATTLAICAIIVHRIVSTEDPRAVEYISISV